MEISASIRLMKALADSSRLLVINSLMEKPQYVEELSKRLDLAPSTISFHLKKLEEAELVTKVKEQYYVVYHVNEKLLGLTLEKIISFNNIEKFVQDERVEQYRQKILSTFCPNGLLEQLPAQHKKRLIILDEFVKKFEFGKTYTEKEVNEIIKTGFGEYNDYCIIRRLMIDELLMKREQTTYWLFDKEQSQQPVEQETDPIVFLD